MKIERDGVALAYEEAGSGDPTVVLIHGWGNDRGALAPQSDSLRATHRVIAVDLRGFGESSKPVEGYAVEDHADDVAFLTDRLGARSFVVIGHSMGGLVALDVAARYPERVLGTVILESFVAPSEAALVGMREMLGRLQHDEDFPVRLMTHLLGDRVHPEQRARMLAVVTACPRHVLVAAFEGMLAYASRAAASRVRGPLLYVGTDTPYADEEELRRACPQVVIERLSGRGHYFPLEAPDALDPLLARFMSEIAITRG